MEEVFRDYLDVLETLHETCQAQISGMSQDELDWRPGDDMNSLAILAAHIAGAERYWIGDVVMGEASGRDRDREFSTVGVNCETLSSHMASAFEYVRRAFERLTVGQLCEVRVSPRDGREYTVAWSIAHVLSHTALHLGHMQITRQLVNAK